jgi:hypothetical protein
MTIVNICVNLVINIWTYHRKELCMWVGFALEGLSASVEAKLPKNQPLHFLPIDLETV